MWCISGSLCSICSSGWMQRGRLRGRRRPLRAPDVQRESSPPSPRDGCIFNRDAALPWRTTAGGSFNLTLTAGAGRRFAQIFAHIALLPQTRQTPGLPRPARKLGEAHPRAARLVARLVISSLLPSTRRERQQHGDPRPHQDAGRQRARVHQAAKVRQLLWPQDRHRRQHAHLPVPHSRGPRGRAAAHERGGRRHQPPAGHVLPPSQDARGRHQARLRLRRQAPAAQAGPAGQALRPPRGGHRRPAGAGRPRPACLASRAAAPVPPPSLPPPLDHPFPAAIRPPGTLAGSMPVLRCDDSPPRAPPPPLPLRRPPRRRATRRPSRGTASAPSRSPASRTTSASGCCASWACPWWRRPPRRRHSALPGCAGALAGRWRPG
jgi:hypothetical protein